MKEFRDKVAVVTGAASGIGRSLAEQCCRHGMKVVLADVEAEALWHAEKDLTAAGATVLAVQTDVSTLEEVQALARQTLATFGAVHLLFNNAGVAAGGTIWGSTCADWEWVLGVNLWGVIHALRVFVPVMLAQETECQIVNTASIAGLLPRHGSASYGVSKRAVVALSEQLYYELAERNTAIRVSVLCPGWVNTRILESARNRPPAVQHVDYSAQALCDADMVKIATTYRQMVKDGMSPDELAGIVFAAIAEERFYILAGESDFMPMVQTRFEDLLQGRNPTRVE